ncbi:hypothetical protein GH825_30200 [Bacillus thuringiensis]|nr:hypothetical protein [Bacillus thuringiensis]
MDKETEVGAILLQEPRAGLESLRPQIKVGDVISTNLPDMFSRRLCPQKIQLIQTNYCGLGKKTSRRLVAMYVVRK